MQGLGKQMTALDRLMQHHGWTVRRVVAGGALTLAMAMPHAAGARDPVPVPRASVAQLAAQCVMCHGPNGHGTELIPRLAGQNRKSLALMIKSFRSGKTTGTIMNHIARGYSEREIEALAAYFSRVRPKAPLAQPPQDTPTRIHP